MTTDFRQRPEFKLGRSGERRVADFLQEKGFYVIPSYDYSGEDDDKAPRMQGKKTVYVIPDLDICRAGLRQWVEVKTKTRATHYRKTDQLQHGIDERHFAAYRAVQAESGCEVFLAIYELTPRPVVLVASIDDLDGLVDHHGTSNGSRMLYWDRRVFREYDLPTEVCDGTDPND